MRDEIEKRLFEMQDTEYRDFQSKLMPTVEKGRIIGVRTPSLRKLAKELAKQPAYDAFLNGLPHKYYEEDNLHAFLLEQIKDFDRAVCEIDRFLPYVDNWATCDMMSPKVLLRYPDRLIEKIDVWLSSGDTYAVRFGIKMLMSGFLDDRFLPEYADRVAAVRSDEYYVKMMAAWYFATALAKQYEAVLPYITEHRLDTWTHNKAIQKALESNRITPERKAYLRTLKIK